MMLANLYGSRAKMVEDPRRKLQKAAAKLALCLISRTCVLYVTLASRLNAKSRNSSLKMWRARKR